MPIGVGFVGNGSDKFTEKGEYDARTLIEYYLLDAGADIRMVSGHAPVGGIDIWAEQEADSLGIPLDIKAPDVHQWDPPGQYGFKARNLDIANDSDILHVILADVLPIHFTGRAFGACYHCAKRDEREVTHSMQHVKSGGCWTGWKAWDFGKEVHWHIVRNY